MSSARTRAASSIGRWQPPNWTGPNLHRIDHALSTFGVHGRRIKKTEVARTRSAIDAMARLLDHLACTSGWGAGGPQLAQE